MFCPSGGPAKAVATVRSVGGVQSVYRDVCLSLSLEESIVGESARSVVRIVVVVVPFDDSSRSPNSVASRLPFGDKDTDNGCLSRRANERTVANETDPSKASCSTNRHTMEVRTAWFLLECCFFWSAVVGLEVDDRCRSQCVQSIANRSMALLLVRRDTKTRHNGTPVVLVGMCFDKIAVRSER